MKTKNQSKVLHRKLPQRGAALIILMLAIVLSLVTLVTFRSERKGPELEAQRKTTLALAQAKEALIGFAVGVKLGSSARRPGDLPCPDFDNDGDAETSCGDMLGSLQERRIGRLPWKTLGLPDLRDGYGERLWYAVSNNFKNNTRTSILNSDTLGTITVRDSKGNLYLDATGATGAIAVIFSPGPPLTRQDGHVQNRVCVPCDALEKCTATPATNTPHCDPINYLDIAPIGEDNKNFEDGSADNGFVLGPIVNASQATVLNDRLITISSADLMPVLEKRVAGEVLFCLAEYAGDSRNQGRYPWAAPLNVSAAPSYLDVSGARFGRIPDTQFTRTVTESGANPMSGNWGANCNIFSGSGWWLNWKEMVFYALADAHKPVDLSTPPGAPEPACGVTGTCLTVNAPSAVANKQVVVFVAGRRLSDVSGGQPRASSDTNLNNIYKAKAANYLENQNATTSDGVFERSPISPTFNDVLVFSPK